MPLDNASNAQLYAGLPIADHASLRAALEAGNLQTLLMVYVHLTRDEDMLDRFAACLTSPFAAPKDLPPELVQELREKLFAVLTRDPPPLAEPLPAGLMQRMMSVGVGEPVADEFIPLMIEQAGFEEPISRLAKPGRIKPPSDFKVLVIGAGMAGLAMAIKLKDAGYSFEVYEKNGEVGGTWYENVYPGIGVDTPSHFYSLSFAQYPDWNNYHPRGHDMQAYLVGVADRFQLRPNIRFGARVKAMRWNDARKIWSVTVEDSNGERIAEANAVVNGHGPVNRWDLPDIEGRETFKGPMMHTAGWDPSIDLTGKRVAVVGTGASGAQVVSALAGKAAHLTIFQRSKHWVMKNAEYDNDVTEPVKWALRNVPQYMPWFRFRAFWFASDGLYKWVKRDPAWEGNDQAISQANEDARQYALAGMKGVLAHRSDVLEKITPDFPIFSKRIILDAGYLAALGRDDVDVETGGIERIVEDGIVTKDGRKVKANAIIFATGFKIAKMVGDLTIIGRDGRNLGEEWGDEDPRAYLGTSMEGFPNFFWLVGPNSVPNHAGGHNLIVEGHVHYIIECLDMLLNHGAQALEPTKEAFGAYNAQVDGDLETMVWSHPKARSYYRNSKGRVYLSCPYRLVDMWTMLRKPKLQDYKLHYAEAEETKIRAASA
ncbi:MAG TPA: NAD(P)-binding protein [Alphaproteobacteria bacterium]|nr:NAD(P)-binding protein [Alphaproteobacteria bacterium]